MRHRLRTYLLAGLLVILPAGVTAFVLIRLFQFLDSLLAPIFDAMGIGFTGLGLVTGVLLIFVVGALASNVLGRRVVSLFDRVMLRLPLARTIYSATKQVSGSLFQQNRAAFQRVVLVEYPRKGLYSVGFVTGETRRPGKDDGEERAINVFMMHTPNPATGILCLVPEDELIPLDMSVEDALKLIVSGGILVPPRLAPTLARRLHTDRVE